MAGKWRRCGRGCESKCKFVFVLLLLTSSSTRSFPQWAVKFLFRPFRAWESLFYRQILRQIKKLPYWQRNWATLWWAMTQISWYLMCQWSDWNPWITRTFVLKRTKKLARVSTTSLAIFLTEENFARYVFFLYLKIFC